MALSTLRDLVADGRNILIASSITVEVLRADPDRVYVFNDNLLRRGQSGQASIRQEPNAFGVPTKRLPSMTSLAFFSDQPEEKAAVIQALRDLYRLSLSAAIVFPAGGLGTGPSQMAVNSPDTYRAMCNILAEHFGLQQ